MAKFVRLNVISDNGQDDEQVILNTDLIRCVERGVTWNRSIVTLTQSLHLDVNLHQEADSLIVKHSMDYMEGILCSS